MKKSVNKIKFVLLIFSTLLFLHNSSPCYAIVHKQKPPEKELKIDISKLKTIEVTNKNYRAITDDIQANPVKYKGKEIIISGFIFAPDADESDDESGYIIKPDDSPPFYVSRLWMYCCAADAQIIGLSVHWKNSSKMKLKEGDWVKIAGNVEAQTDEPFIKAVKVEKIKPPENQYVY